MDLSLPDSSLSPALSDPDRSDCDAVDKNTVSPADTVSVLILSHFSWTGTLRKSLLTLLWRQRLTAYLLMTVGVLLEVLITSDRDVCLESPLTGQAIAGPTLFRVTDLT